MKPKSISLSFILYFLFIKMTFISAQITINSGDMPTSGYSQLMSQRTIIASELPGYTLAGENKTWNFTSIDPLTQQNEDYISSTSGDIQFICIAIFNNPFDQQHKATVARKGLEIQSPIPEMQLSDVFEFFKNSNDAYTMVGRSTSINSVPFCIKNEPSDTLFSFPLTYGKSYSTHSSFNITVPEVGYYEETINRSCVVDGWGTLISKLDTFNVLRVKMTIQFLDSMYYEQMGMGFKFPRNETHYFWLSKDLKVPVFLIQERGAMGGGTVAFWPDKPIDSYQDFSKSNVQVYPVPATEELYVETELKNWQGQKISIIDLFGREICSSVITDKISIIDVRSCKTGIYFVRLGKSSFLQKVSIINKSL